MNQTSSPAGISAKSLQKRVATGLVYGVVGLTAVYMGTSFMALPLLLGVMSYLALSEFIKITDSTMAHTPRYIGLVTTFALPVTTGLALLARSSNPVFGEAGLDATVVPLFVLVIALAAYAWWGSTTVDAGIRDIALSFFGAAYIGLPLTFLTLIRDLPFGLPISFGLVLSVAASDSFAYFAGSLFGRHKLAPKISPKKSWEGLAGGAVGAILVWWVTGTLIEPGFDLWVAVLFGIAITLAALVGDLFASRIKREAGVKDSGTLLPGHGGMFDRIDSMLTAIPLAFVFLSTVGVLLHAIAL